MAVGGRSSTGAGPPAPGQQGSAAVLRLPAQQQHQQQPGGRVLELHSFVEVVRRPRPAPGVAAPLRPGGRVAQLAGGPRQSTWPGARDNSDGSDGDEAGSEGRMVGSPGFHERERERKRRRRLEVGAGDGDGGGAAGAVWPPAEQQQRQPPPPKVKLKLKLKLKPAAHKAEGSGAGGAGPMHGRPAGPGPRQGLPNGSGSELPPHWRTKAAAAARVGPPQELQVGPQLAQAPDGLLGLLPQPQKRPLPGGAADADAQEQEQEQQQLGQGAGVGEAGAGPRRIIRKGVRQAIKARPCDIPPVPVPGPGMCVSFTRPRIFVHSRTLSLLTQVGGWRRWHTHSNSNSGAAPGIPGP